MPDLSRFRSQPGVGRKPTEAQRRVLEAMANGATIKRHRNSSNGIDHVRLEPCDAKTIHPANNTFRSLCRAGWIVESRGKPDWWETWTLTAIAIVVLAKTES